MSHTLTEIARAAGCSRTVVSKMVSQGKLHATKVESHLTPVGFHYEVDGDLGTILAVVLNESPRVALRHALKKQARKQKQITTAPMPVANGNGHGYQTDQLRQWAALSGETRGLLLKLAARFNADDLGALLKL